jgi:hypothetical protein
VKGAQVFWACLEDNSPLKGKFFMSLFESRKKAVRKIRILWIFNTSGCKFTALKYFLQNLIKIYIEAIKHLNALCAVLSLFTFQRGKNS